ncbi:hypothetical protein HK102_005306 [Quaeritorhiza haematococci]|nr:hypothetical protein HK102_005306 [Quaeritorhiza haematococci]
MKTLLIILVGLTILVTSSTLSGVNGKPLPQVSLETHVQDAIQAAAGDARFGNLGLRVRNEIGEENPSADLDEEDDDADETDENDVSSAGADGQEGEGEESGDEGGEDDDADENDRDDVGEESEDENVESKESDDGDED